MDGWIVEETIPVLSAQGCVWQSSAPAKPAGSWGSRCRSPRLTGPGPYCSWLRSPLSEPWWCPPPTASSAGWRVGILRLWMKSEWWINNSHQHRVNASTGHSPKADLLEYFSETCFSFWKVDSSREGSCCVLTSSCHSVICAGNSR